MVNQVMFEKEIAGIDSFIAQDMQDNADYLRQVAISFGERQAIPLHLKILFLSLDVIGYQGPDKTQLGVILEYVFAATELHDNTMEQNIRCQNEVVSQGLKGTSSRILVGDFFYSRAFYLMSKLGEMKVISNLSNAINQYSEGQSLQICQAKDISVTESMYQKRLNHKACLYFSCIGDSVAAVGGCTNTHRQALHDYCLYSGKALQIIEETLSCIRANSADKLKQSTLPLIYIRGLNQAPVDLAQQIEASITGNAKSSSSYVVNQICLQTDALTYTRGRIKLEVNLAVESLGTLPETEHRLELHQLAAELLIKFDNELANLGYKFKEL